MNEVVFKTAVMGGFNKEDVLAFIDRQDAQFRAREQELVTRLNNMSAQYKNMSEEKDLVVYENNELKKQIQDEKNKTGQNSYQATLLKSELDKTKSDCEQKLNEVTVKLSASEQHISELEARLASQSESFDAERKSLQARIFDSTQSAQELNTELENKNADIERLTSSANDWEQKYTACAAELNQLKEQSESGLSGVRQSYEAQIAQIKNDYETQIEQLKGGYETQIAQLKGDCDTQLNQLRSDYEAQLAKLKSDCDAQIGQIKNDYEAQLSQLKSNYESKLSATRNESDTYKNKLELIDKTEEQIGRALLEAQKTADNIISVANKKAKDITVTAEENAASTESWAREALKNLFSESDKRLKIMLDSTVSFKKRITEAHESANSFFSEIGTILGCIETDADEICSGFAKTIGHEEMLLDKPQETATDTAQSTPVLIPSDFDDDNYLSETEIRNAHTASDEDDELEAIPEGVSLEELEDAALGTTGLDCFSTEDLEALDGIPSDCDSSGDSSGGDLSGGDSSGSDSQSGYSGFDFSGKQ